MFKPKIEIKEKNKDSEKKLKDVFQKMGKSFVTIGVHENAGQYEDGTSVVQVALWNEFGTEHIPERSFFRSTLDKHEDQINSWRKEAIEKIIDGKETPEHALESIGFKIRELIKNTILSNVPPPNADSTAAHKRAEGVPVRTLVETNLLLRSVEYHVVMK